MTYTAVPAMAIRNPQLEIAGGRVLSGELSVSGAKNSALVLMAACLLTRDQLRLRNVPPLTDITAMGEMLSSLGCQVVRKGDCLELTGDRISTAAAPSSARAATCNSMLNEWQTVR